MRMKGNLIRWNEERGFGFIESNDINNDIFIHISELKTMPRRPMVNDVIYFSLAKDKNRKFKAVNAKIEGVPVKKPNVYATKHKNTAIKPIMFICILIMGISLYAYSSYPNWTKSIPNSIQNVFYDEDFAGYSCQGKQYCSEMTSCNEARFYLKNCPNVKIDGNNDGVPCESQWCN